MRTRPRSLPSRLMPPTLGDVAEPTPRRGVLRRALGFPLAGLVAVSAFGAGAWWADATASPPEPPGVGLAALPGADPAAPSDASWATVAGGDEMGPVSDRSRPQPTTPATAPGDFGLFWEALEAIQDGYVGPEAVDEADLTRGAIRGMVEALGDTGHTVYLTPEERRARQDALDGTVVGIGVIVDSRAGSPLILSVIDGSPADGAGLQPGDLIVSVDGADVRRLDLDEVVERVRGEEGSSVRLRVERPGVTVPLSVEVVRQRVDVPATSWALVPGTATALVRLVQFSAGAAGELKAALDQARDAGATSIVLDLRGNPGGQVDQALAVASIFLEEGVVYRVQFREGRPRPVHAIGRPIEPDVPLVALVDYGSASSAEIVAAALQDNGRARVIGERTYGTGTILSEVELSDGSAIWLATARWLPPGGPSVFGRGVTPDEEVGLAPGARILGPDDLRDLDAASFAASDDVQLKRAIQVLSGKA